jgi:hypothetical protein
MRLSKSGINRLILLLVYEGMENRMNLCMANLERCSCGFYLGGKEFVEILGSFKFVPAKKFGGNLVHAHLKVKLMELGYTLQKV